MTPVVIGNVLIIIAAFLSTVGPVLYGVLPHTRKTWYKDNVGRHLMTYMTVFALVLDLSVISIVTGATRNNDWFAWVRTMVFIFVPFVLGWRDWLVVRSYFKREEKDESVD